MGSKQSKRSVDISGKEGEAVTASVGEVVAAGGEGRVEPIADVDTLKPQINGDTPHIETAEHISEKEKQLENGTPENEKDATTEKETIVTNGSGEEQDNPEQENGDVKPAPEADIKKSKKEKVKKKWSLRSISFSRKDKPKQEKKQKDEETKINGEADKLPEENAETCAIVEQPEKIESEKTPETPVTEPITNAISTPETEKEKATVKELCLASNPVLENITPTTGEEKAADQVKSSGQLEKVLTNGMFEETKEEVKVVEAVTTKVEEIPLPASEEPASSPENPVIAEVCVGQNPLNDTTPPPLPASPPPSSFTAFAETTMAPHLIDAPITPVPEESNTHAAIEVKSSSISDVPLSYNEKETQPLDDSTVRVKVESDHIIAENPLELTNEAQLLETKKPNVVAERQDHIEYIADEKSEPSLSSGGSSYVTNIHPIFDNTTENTAQVNKVNEPNDAQIVNVSEPKYIHVDTHNAVTNEDYKANEKTIEIEESAIQESLKTITHNVTNTEKVESAALTNGIYQINRTKLNGSLVETDSPVDESSNLISDEQIGVSDQPIIIVKSESSSAENDMLPPPTSPQPTDENMEENGASNEEVSDTFPPPPSDLCPTESEVSDPASLEAIQETMSSPVEKTEEISVPEINSDKLADMKEQASAVLAAANAEATLGAGDGAPSD